MHFGIAQGVTEIMVGYILFAICLAGIIIVVTKIKQTLKSKK